MLIQVSHVKKIEEDRGQRNWNNRNNWAAHIGLRLIAHNLTAKKLF